MDRMRPSTPKQLLIEILQLLPKKLLPFIFGSRLHYADKEGFLNLLRGGFSVYRWGDGETAICRGKDISYQLADPKLAQKLLELLKLRNREIIHGLPWVYSVSLFSRRWSRKKFKILFSTRVFLNKHHKRKSNLHYVEGHIWYSVANELRKVLSQILGARKVILVASNPEFLTLCPTGTHFISAPQIDAFSRYHEICRDLDGAIESLAPHESLTILVAIGPTSKAIVRDYFEKAQVIDVGHGFNFALKGPGSYAWTK